MRPTKRRKIGVLANRETRDEGTNEAEPAPRATVVEEGDVIKVTFGGDTEDELDDLDEDDEQDHSQSNGSPLTTRVLIRYDSTLISDLGDPCHFLNYMHCHFTPSPDFASKTFYIFIANRLGQDLPWERLSYMSSKLLRKVLQMMQRLRVVDPVVVGLSDLITFGLSAIMLSETSSSSL